MKKLLFYMSIFCMPLFIVSGNPQGSKKKQEQLEKKRKGAQQRKKEAQHQQKKSARNMPPWLKMNKNGFGCGQQVQKLGLKCSECEESCVSCINKNEFQLRLAGGTIFYTMLPLVGCVITTWDKCNASGSCTQMEKDSIGNLIPVLCGCYLSLGIGACVLDYCVSKHKEKKQ